jgi:hypothetical protein
MTATRGALAGSTRTDSAYYTLMTKGGACAPSIALKDLQSGPDGVDWLGGRWEDIGLWTPKSFFSRAEQRVAFDEAGSRDGVHSG